jgi:hypothetical protein
MREFFKSLQVKGFIAGVVFTLLLTGTVALASTVTRTIEVHFRNIRIFMDGEELIPRDAAGNPVEPFMYGGTTFLPVRAVADAFDKVVSWDGDNAFIHLDTPVRTGFGQVTSTGTNFQSANQHPTVHTEPIVWPHRMFTSAVTFNSRPDSPGAGQQTWAESQLGGNYSTLNVTIGRVRPVDERDEFSAVITFIGDGRTLYTTNVSADNPDTFAVSLDVSGISLLRTEVTTTPAPNSQPIMQRLAIAGYLYP